MKKFIIILIIIMLAVFNVKAFQNKIPEDAIRVRVIANSNSTYDQEIKTKVSNLVKNEMYYLLKDINNVEDARIVIKNNLDKIDNNIYSLLKKGDYNLGYTINYGYNYFPKKEYKGNIYEEGYYESLLVTLGKGEGENWWCLLFPPFCLVEAEENEKVEYSFFLTEIINKIFN